MMKTYTLTLGQYENLMKLRDVKSPGSTLTNFVRHEFNVNLKHRMNDKKYDAYNSSSESYKWFDAIVTCTNEEFTWFILHL